VSTTYPLAGADRLSGRAWGALFVLCGAIFLEAVDITMLNVALPAIRADLGLSTAMLSGAVSAYVLGYGGFMLLGGRVADQFGRRRVLLISLGVFLVFSAVGGFAGDGWTLLVARFVKGVAAAFMTPAGLSLITTGFAEGPQRNKALLVYAGTASGGYSLGLVVGGLLATLAGVILLGGLALLPDTGRPERAGRESDVAGAVVVTAAMLLLAYGVVRLEDTASGLVWALAAVLGGVALLGAFVAIERRSAAPLLRLGILRSGPLVRANLASLLFVGSFFGFFFLITLYLREVRGWSTWETALALLVVGIDAVLAPTLTPWLVRRFGTVRVIFGGILIGGIGYALFLPVGLDWAYLAMFPSLVLLGVAFALTYGPLTIAATDGVAESEQGLASGLLNTSFQFGAALGLSSATAVSVAALGPVLDPLLEPALAAEAELDALRTGLIVPVVGVLLAALVTAFGLRRRVERTDA
jgi:MFS family permease